MPWKKPTASSAARGYGSQHRKLRAKLLLEAYGQPCYRCGMPMLPHQALHLDHTDDRTGYGGMSHAVCNRKAAAAKAKLIRTIRKGRRVVVNRRLTPMDTFDNSREWWPYMINNTHRANGETHDQQHDTST